MAPPIVFAPRHTCRNYPICTSQAEKITLCGKRTYTDFCSSCSSAATCSFPECKQFCAPHLVQGQSIHFCTDHYRDLAMTQPRSWEFCSNAKRGYSQLAVSKRGGKCFACTTHNLPCVNATSGCPRHVRCDPNEPPWKRRACSDRGHHRCTYDPAHPSACPTFKCGNTLSPPQVLCTQCSSGETPCLNNACLRRSVEGLCGYCLPCSTAHTTESSSTSASDTTSSGTTSSHVLPPVPVNSQMFSSSVQARSSGLYEVAHNTFVENELQVESLLAGHAPRAAC